MLRSGLASRMHTIYARKKRRVSATEGSEGVGPETTKARGGAGFNRFTHRRCCIFSMTLRSRKQRINSGNTYNKVLLIPKLPKIQPNVIYIYIFFLGVI